MFDTLYNAIDLILPFQWLSHTFMKNAFIAIIIITPLFGLLSTMVVSNKMSFFADSLGHGAFTGIAVGILLGGIDPMWGATLFSICFAIAITIIKNKGTSSTDTIIGVFSSTSIAFGIAIHLNDFLKYPLFLNISSVKSDGAVAIETVFEKYLCINCSYFRTVCNNV